MSDHAIAIRKSEPAVIPLITEPVLSPAPVAAVAWDSSTTDTRSINAIDLALIDYGAPGDEAEPDFEFDCIAADTISARLR